MRKNFTRLAYIALALMFVLAACGTPAPAATEAPAAATEAPSAATEAPAAATEAPAAEQLAFGVLMGGPYNENGWERAH